MKNNIIKIILIIIISLNLFHYSFADDFDFNVTEIQVSNNGNIIKGRKIERSKGIFSLVPKIFKK